MTQEAFAAAYRIRIGTLRDCEQGRKRPDAPAHAYLTVIARNPKPSPVSSSQPPSPRTLQKPS